MKRLLFLAPLALLACNKAADCPPCPEVPPPPPPGYVCGPRDAYAFPPAKGTTIKVATEWKTRVAIAEKTEDRATTFNEDDICVLIQGTELKVLGSDKSFVLAQVSSAPNDEPAPGGRRCPDTAALIPVHQWALMADEARIVDDEQASLAAKAERLKHAHDLIPTAAPR